MSSIFSALRLHRCPYCQFATSPTFSSAWLPSPLSPSHWQLSIFTLHVVRSHPPYLTSVRGWFCELRVKVCLWGLRAAACAQDGSFCLSLLGSCLAVQSLEWVSLLMRYVWYIQGVRMFIFITHQAGFAHVCCVVQCFCVQLPTHQ